MDLWSLLADIVLLLSACLLLGGLFSRFGQSPLIGYILAGMLLGGPGSLHLIRSRDEIEAIAELGVALLLFSLGLEFSIQRLKKLGTKPLLGGIAQILLTILLGALAAYLFGLGFAGSVAFGAMISLSSTAIVLRMLMERGEMETPHGRECLGVLLTQDMAVVPLALLMTILGGDGTTSEVLLDIGKLLLMASTLVLALFLLNQIAVLALGTLTLRRNRELTVIFAVVTGLGAAWASHFAGVSPALGAFVAGMLLGSSAFATQIRADISSLRVVLLTMFFGAAGMVADPIWILQHWYLVGAATFGLMAGKSLLIWAIFQWLGHSSRIAIAIGLCLSQTGEFAFVLGSIGRVSGVVSEDIYALVVSITIVSFFLSAFLVPSAPKLGNYLAAKFGAKLPATDSEAAAKDGPDIVIIGFGPAGQIASRPFIDNDKKVVVVDLNQMGVRLADQSGFQGEVGDATQTDVLEHVRISQAKVVVITVPHHASAITILEQVRQLAPLAHVLVRSRYKVNTDDFVTAGAHVVVGDEEQVGDRLAAELQQWITSNAKTKEQTATTNQPDDS